MTSQYETSRTTALIERLQQELTQTYPHWQIGELTIVGAGLDALVCQAESVAFGPIAIRVPWTRWISNDNDSLLDARVLLTQEAAIAKHMRQHGVATPTIFGLHLGADSFDFLVSELIIHDGSAPDQHAFGQLMRAIHDAPVLNIPIAIQGDSTIEDTIAERLTQRAAVVERLAQVQLQLPSQREIAALLQWPQAKRAMLHMDARPANLLTNNHVIRAIIDWSNALIGDPALELARIAEYGLLDAAFLAGYGLPDCFAQVPPVVELLYRLDTAIMLAVVFLSEAPDPDQAATQIKRVSELCATLNQFYMAPHK